MKTLLLSVCAVCVAVVAMPAEAGVTITGVDQKPWIVDDGGMLKSETELNIDNGQNQALDAWVKIGVAGKPEYVEPLGSLAAGKNAKVVHVVELAKDGDEVTFAVYDNAGGTGEPLARRTLAQQKIRHWRLYVGHNTHLDIGYTDYQEILKDRKWPGFWDKALLTDMPNSDSWPDEAKVRLEVEGVFQLNTALRVRTADWFEMLRTRLTQGRFAYGAAFANIAHSNNGAEELARSTYYSERFFRDKTGVPSSKNIIMRDEPTLSWGVIDAMVEAGAKSFSIHHNSDHNPWRGTTAYPELFYAQGKNPANKLLVWNSPVANYCVDELDFRGKNLANLTTRISAKLMGYQSGGRIAPTEKYAPAKAVDGVIGRTDEGEWASNGEQTPWLRLAWTAPQTVNKICLFDRPNGLDNANGGTLSFSDGSSLKVTGLPHDGKVKEVTFPDKQVTWVRFHATEGEGWNVGMAEIQVFAGTKNVAPEAAVTASSTFGVSSHVYPYDVAMVNFTDGGDNGPMITQVYLNVKALNDKGYAWPRIINANYNQFFDDVTAHYSESIPVFKGTIEDWWNFGAASTAYETGLNRMNHDKLAAAESLATVAMTASNLRYPCETLARAYENLLLYDEHTWGSPAPAVDDQWRWKRNTAIAADVASTKVLRDSLASINALIPTTGKTIVVYNNLTWPRSDLVTVGLDVLPPHFELTDVESNAAVKYQKLDDGTLVFVAPNVPGLGYKTFRVTPRSDDPVFPSGVTGTANTLENQFFKVSFNAAGNVTSILDKQNKSAEMVDPSAPEPLNQYLIYKEGVLVGQVEKAEMANRVGPILGSMTADVATTGLDSLRRTVVLYDSLPRIDIVNDAVKGPQIANVEMGYFAFPLKIDNFLLRHEMPTGDMRPGVNPDINDPANEQYYTSSTAFYTVNRWVDASNQRDWGVTFASLQAPLLSYGKPDIGMSKGGWKVNYNSPKPWIYSMAFNNEWQTNFQKTQPGRAVFQYSLRGHTGGTWQAGHAETFGAERASPLKSAVIAAAQPGRDLDAANGQFLRLDKDNVLLTTAKLSEANGEGLVLRFNEIQGIATTVKVDLSAFGPSSVVETDLIENDRSPLPLTDNTITLTLSPFGFKTIRLVRGDAPPAIAGLSARFNDGGCLVTWTDQPDAACFEVFRGTASDFTPGSGTHVATVSVNHYFDPAVKTGLQRSYFYAVRAVHPGKKGPFAASAQATDGLPPDTAPPSAPMVSGEALHPTKVTLSWLPATDDRAVQGYKVYRDGTQVADVAESLNSWLDTAAKPGSTYQYVVRAYDAAGNLSPAGSPVVVKTGGGTP